MKKKVLLFARSFLAEYYSDIKSDIIEPIFVTLTHEEKIFLEGKGWNVFGCFEDEYENIPIYNNIPSDYLRTSFASDRYLKRFSYNKRLEILGKEISFWAKILDEVKPTCLFNETVAIEIAEVMAIEAEKRSIPFYSALLGFLPDSFYWKPSPFDGSLADLSEINPTDDEYDKARKYIEDIKVKRNKPFYINDARKGGVSFFKMVKSTIGDFRRMYKNAKRLAKKRTFTYEDFSHSFLSTYREYKLQKKFKYNSIDEIKEKDCFFFPMHLEPEATINYFVAEDYTQTTLIDLIAKSMGINQYLVVKEHPQHPGILLRPEYQQLRDFHKNIFFLPSYESSYNVLDYTKAVITLTSSAAWEGLILGKPAIVLGTIFYDQCPGVYKLNNIRDIRKIVRNKIESPNEKDVLTFAAKMISLYKKGCPTPCAENTGLIGYVKAMEEIVKADDKD